MTLNHRLNNGVLRIGKLKLTAIIKRPRFYSIVRSVLKYYKVETEPRKREKEIIILQITFKKALSSTEILCRRPRFSISASLFKRLKASTSDSSFWRIWTPLIHLLIFLCWNSNYILPNSSSIVHSQGFLLPHQQLENKISLPLSEWSKLIIWNMTKQEVKRTYDSFVSLADIKVEKSEKRENHKPSFSQN